MAESNRMKEMPVNKLMVQMGIPMILSMALQAVYNIVDSAFVGNMRSGSEAEKMISVNIEQYQVFNAQSMIIFSHLSCPSTELFSDRV